MAFAPTMKSRFAQNDNIRVAGSFSGAERRPRYVDFEGDYAYEEIDHKREREINSIERMMSQRTGYCG